MNAASGQLRLRHWLSDAPTTRIDLIHFFYLSVFSTLEYVLSIFRKVSQYNKFCTFDVFCAVICTLSMNLQILIKYQIQHQKNSEIKVAKKLRKSWRRNILAKRRKKIRSFLTFRYTSVSVKVQALSNPNSAF
jgi:hypothetical protein